MDLRDVLKIEVSEKLPPGFDVTVAEPDIGYFYSEQGPTHITVTVRCLVTLSGQEADAGDEKAPSLSSLYNMLTLLKGALTAGKASSESKDAD